MESLNTFCLAGIVFLSLPLPLFASASLGVCPSARRSLMSWVWGNSIVLGVLGLLLVTTSAPPLAELAAGCLVFLACGLQMFVRLARAKGASGD